MGLYKVYDKFRRYWRQIHMLTIRDGWKKIENVEPFASLTNSIADSLRRWKAFVIP